MKRSSVSSAEEVFGSTGTLSEILLRLPSKSLFRFKCVSKQWLTLISDLQFCHHHTPSALLIGPSPHYDIVPLIPTWSTTPSMVCPLNLDFLRHPRVSVVRSCNGLLLCNSGPTYFVCNPTTRKFVTLSFPNQQQHGVMNQIRALYLAFDPLRSPRYQVISIRILPSHLFPRDRRCECVINVYSSGTRLWSDPGVCFTASYEVITGAGVYFNGAIHLCNDTDWSSVYFDIDSQCLKNLPMPLVDSEWGKNRSVEYFGESGGHLHLILVKGRQSLVFDILELKEDYSEWLLKHHVDLNFTRVKFPELHWGLANFVLPSYIICQGKEENSMLVLLVGGTVISYDTVNCICTARKLCDFKPDMTTLDAVAAYMLGEVFPYCENRSLV